MLAGISLSVTCIIELHREELHCQPVIVATALFPFIASISATEVSLSIAFFIDVVSREGEISDPHTQLRQEVIMQSSGIRLQI